MQAQEPNVPLLSWVRGVDHQYILLDEVQKVVQMLCAGWEALQPLDELEYRGYLLMAESSTPAEMLD